MTDIQAYQIPETNLDHVRNEHNKEINMNIINKNLNIPGSRGVVSVGEFASGHIVRIGAIGTLRGLTFVAVNTDGTTKAFKSMWRAEKHLIRSDGR